MTPTRVVVIDDQALVRDGFTMILEEHDDIDVVAAGGDGRAGLELCRRHRPDVALMDIRMPKMDGIEATGLISNDPTLATKVLVLTTFDLDEYVYAALRSGACGFLLKDTPKHELVQAVRVVANGDGLIAPSITRRLIAEFSQRPDASNHQASLPADLTARELEAFELLARGLTNKEIAQALAIGEATAKTHVSRLLMKLGVRDRVHAVIAAYETGLVQPGDHGPTT